MGTAQATAESLPLLQATLGRANEQEMSDTFDKIFKQLFGDFFGPKGAESVFTCASCGNDHRNELRIFPPVKPAPMFIGDLEFKLRLLCGICALKAAVRCADIMRARFR